MASKFDAVAMSATDAEKFEDETDKRKFLTCGFFSWLLGGFRPRILPPQPHFENNDAKFLSFRKTHMIS